MSAWARADKKEVRSGANVGHVNDTFVPSRSADMGESNTRVTSCTFDDRSSRFDLALSNHKRPQESSLM